MNKSPKVLMVVNSISGGGAENSAMKVFEELRGREVDIELIALNQFEERQVLGDKRITTLSRNWRDGLFPTVQNFLDFNKQIHKIQPKIIIAHCELPELYIALVPKLKLHLIAVEHTTNPWDGRKTLGKIVRTLLKWRKVFWVTVTAGNNGIWLGSEQPIHIFNPVSVSSEHSDFKFEEEYAFIGRLRKEKRPEWAIEAALENSTPIGVFGDGVLADELHQEYSSNHGLVKFYGFVDNPWPMLKKETLVIMPSEYEGDGLVAVEAIINGFAIVLSDNPDLRRLGLPAKHYFRTVKELSDKIAQTKQNGTSMLRPPDSVTRQYISDRKLDNVAVAWINLLQVVANRG
jgi:glycosyltransferase involved in cell wall biosynthesis